MGNNIVDFPKQPPKDYGELFHEVMDICGDVQLNGKDHLDATVEIMEIVEKYIEYGVEIGCKYMTDEYDKLANVIKQLAEKTTD